MNYRIAGSLNAFEGEGAALAERGRLEIQLAEKEMPGLMVLRKQLQASKPLRGARIAGSLHVTVQTAVFIETLRALGAEVRWAPCNILSTQDYVAAALAQAGVPIFAWKEMCAEEYDWALRQTLFFGERPLNLIVDDGGDLTHLVHEEYPSLLAGIRGVSEETTTGVRRLHQRMEKESLGIPAFDVNSALTKSQFDNYYGCRESFLDGLKRATNTMIAGKRAVVVGFGDVGRGCAEALAQWGARVMVTEIDPIRAYQALMKGYEVVEMEEAAPLADLFVTASGCIKVIRAEHMLRMKDQAIVCNMGHFDHEIDVAWLRTESHAESQQVRPGVELFRWPESGKSLLLLAQGRLVNLGCAEGHPSFVMSNSFCNQVLAQMELWNHTERYPIGVYEQPHLLDLEVAKIHLEALGAKLTTLNEEQRTYLSCSKSSL